MDPRLPTSIHRRRGFYIPSSSRSPTHSSLSPSSAGSPSLAPSSPSSGKKEMTDDEITEFYKNQLLQKEKEVEEDIKNEEKSESQRKSIEWKFIKKPSASRLTLQPEGGKKYLFSDRTIEKIVFGDYLLIKYLMRKTKNACFIYPDLMLAVDAIQFIYQLKEMGVPFTIDILENWDNLSMTIKKYPNLVSKYEKTSQIIKDNFKEIKNALKPNEKGPRLEKSEPQYHRLIYELIERMMNKQRIEFDTSGKFNFTIPYPSRLKKCMQSKKKYIVFFLRLKNNDSYHANMIIMDTHKKTVERFEPQGSEHEIYDNEIVDNKIRAYFDSLGYKYIDPTMMSCPDGVQDIVESYTMDKYKLSGFCKTWSFLYGLFRLHLDEMDQMTLVKNMSLLAKETAKSYFEEKHGKTILEEDYKNYDFVIEFLYDYIPNILQEGKEYIEMINKILGTNIVLEGRTLHSKI
jgi:hypothetical protein